MTTTPVFITLKKSFYDEILETYKFWINFRKDVLECDEDETPESLDMTDCQLMTLSFNKVKIPLPENCSKTVVEEAKNSAIEKIKREFSDVFKPTFKTQLRKNEIQTTQVTRLYNNPCYYEDDEESFDECVYPEACICSECLNFDGKGAATATVDSYPRPDSPARLYQLDIPGTYDVVDQALPLATLTPADDKTKHPAPDGPCSPRPAPEPQVRAATAMTVIDSLDSLEERPLIQQPFTENSDEVDRTPPPSDYNSPSPRERDKSQERNPRPRTGVSSANGRAIPVIPRMPGYKHDRGIR